MKQAGNTELDSNMKSTFIFAHPGSAHGRRFSKPPTNFQRTHLKLLREPVSENKHSSIQKEDISQELPASPTDIGSDASKQAEGPLLCQSQVLAPRVSHSAVPADIADSLAPQLARGEELGSCEAGEASMHFCEEGSDDIMIDIDEYEGCSQECATSYLELIEAKEDGRTDTLEQGPGCWETRPLVPGSERRDICQDTTCHSRAEASLEMSSKGRLVHEGQTDQQNAEWKDLREWLQSIECASVAHVFARATLTLQDMPCLQEGDLVELGISTMGVRKRILAAAVRLPGSEQVSRDTEALALNPQKANQPNSHLTSFFRMQQTSTRKSCITDFFAATGGSKGPARSSPVGQGKENREEHPGKAPRGGGCLPEWHRVPGTSFVVDCFGRKVEEVANCRSWFLTHFHADHYMGLNGRFKSGLVYCTRITAKLANARLNVSMNRLKIVPLNEPIIVEGVRVTFIDANHCPGSAMILFQVSGRRPVLHTGDCRYHHGMQQEAVLNSLRGDSLALYLDTTYCMPQYTFPQQQEVLDYVINVFKAEKYNQNKTLFLFGSYTIGKERLFLEAARTLQQKIYVSRAKRKVLEALELPAEYRSLLTENDMQATIQAVPMGFVNLQRMANIAKHYRSRFTTIVGIRPTGWTHTATRGRTGKGRRQKGSLIMYSVPYSEHSSFAELREFVRWLQPAKIVPTVGNDRGPKRSSMLAMLRP